MLFELFSPSGRGLANGIFSWGVYYGYSLAFVFGIYMTQADIFGYGWRSVYVICAIPGIFMGIIIGIFLRDPRYKAYQLADSQVRFVLILKFYFLQFFFHFILLEFFILLFLLWFTFKDVIL